MGISGYSSVMARSNFRVGGQERSPQSPTFHTRNRWLQLQITPYNIIKLDRWIKK